MANKPYTADDVHLAGCAIRSVSRCLHRAEWGREAAAVMDYLAAAGRLLPADVKAAQQTDDPPPCQECQRVGALPEMPEMVPDAAQEWQNGFRWGWYYAVKAVREGRAS